MDAHVDVATVLENYLLDVTKVVETSQTLDRDVIVLQCEVPGFVGRGAGKMIELEPKNTHDAKETNRRIVSRCKKQCDMMQGRRLRHSNIVKFVGIYYRANTVPAPAPTLRLVTEFLPINLTSCIELYNSERHVRLPNAISYSILHDVAKAVSYIHSQAPPIIHRNLHSNNILLDENMTAKITDLGVAKILKHVKYPTRKPGRTEFMPPEAMMEKPKYDTSIDEFAYGVVIIHIFSGEWPVPKRPPSRSDLQEGITKQVVVTEAERRLEYLEKFSKDNPLKHLAEECINNDRNRRPHADEFVKRLSEVVKQTPASDHHRSEVREAVLPRIDSVKIKPGNGAASILEPTSTVTGVQVSSTLGHNQESKPSDSTANNDKGKVPTFSELNLLKYKTNEGKETKIRIIKEAKHKWKDIAGVICPNANKMTTLGQQFNDPEDCLRKVLSENFIDKKPERYEHNWSGLIKLLEDVELEALAKRVEDALSIDSQ